MSPTSPSWCDDLRCGSNGASPAYADDNSETEYGRAAGATTGFEISLLSINARYRFLATSNDYVARSTPLALADVAIGDGRHRKVTQ